MNGTNDNRVINSREQVRVVRHMYELKINTKWQNITPQNSPRGNSHHLLLCNRPLRSHPAACDTQHAGPAYDGRIRYGEKKSLRTGTQPTRR